MIDYRKCGLYQWYDENRMYYYDSPRKAYEDLRDVDMGSACEKYAGRHPDSPFHAELLAVSALLDTSPGSFAWDEYYHKKFNSPEEVWSSAKRKMREWLAEHKGDADVLTLLAAAVRLSHVPEDNNYPGVCDYLYQALLCGDKCEYGYIWGLTAWATGFSKYLSEIKKENELYRSRNPGGYINHKELLGNDKKGFFLVLFSWAIFFLSAAATCFPFLDTESRAVSINWNAAQQFSFDNTFKIIAAGVMILNFAVFVKNTVNQNTAFLLSILWAVAYGVFGSLCMAHSAGFVSGRVSIVESALLSFFIFGGKSLFLIPAAVLSKDIGRSIYWVQHTKPPKYYSRQRIHFDYAFIFICAGISLAGFFLSSDSSRLCHIIINHKILLILLWSMPLFFAKLRSHATDSYLVNAWYSATLAVCFSCLMCRLPYVENGTNMTVMSGVIMILVFIYARGIEKNIEGEAYILYIPYVFSILELLQTILFQQKNFRFLTGHPDTYIMNASAGTAIGLAVYTVLREFLLLKIRKKQADK